jgi:hypothetical protein
MKPKHKKKTDRNESVSPFRKTEMYTKMICLEAVLNGFLDVGEIDISTFNSNIDELKQELQKKLKDNETAPLKSLGVIQSYINSLSKLQNYSKNPDSRCLEKENLQKIFTNISEQKIPSFSLYSGSTDKAKIDCADRINKTLNSLKEKNY